MDLDSIFSSLISADKQAREDAPYRQFGGIMDELGGTIIKGSAARDDMGNRRYSTKDSILSGLIIGALGGLAQRGNDSYIAEQNQMATDALSGILSGIKPQRPDGMSPSIFANMQRFGQVVDLQDKLNTRALQAKADIDLATDARKSQADLKNQLTLALVKAGVDNPYKLERAMSALGPLIGGQAPVAAPEPVVIQPQIGQARPPQAAMEGLIGALGGMREGLQSVTTSPDEALEQAGGNESIAAKILERETQRPERLKGIRAEFESKPEFKTFVLADTGWKSMQKAFLDQSGTSDVELTRGGIQAIEPGLAVRTDDQTAINQSSSIPQEWKAYMIGAVTGKSKLPPEVRSGLMRIAARRHAEWSAKFNDARAFYTGQATGQGLDPAGVSYMGEAVPANEADYPDPGAAPKGKLKLLQVAPGVGFDQSTGTTYRKQGGRWVEVTE